MNNCCSKDGHLYEPVYDEVLEKEFSIGNWHWSRKVKKEKIYKKHLCSFCGDIIVPDNEWKELNK
jgi:hypothetical protein